MAHIALNVIRALRYWTASRLTIHIFLIRATCITVCIAVHVTICTTAHTLICIITHNDTGNPTRSPSDSLRTLQLNCIANGFFTYFLRQPPSIQSLPYLTYGIYRIPPA